jgi:hypothetical protein
MANENLPDLTIEEFRAKQQAQEQVNPAPAPTPSPEPTPTPVPTPQPTPSPEPAGQPTSFDKMGWLKERTGQQFEKEEDFNTHYGSLTEKATKAESYQKTLAEREAELERMKVEQLDPVKIYGSKENAIFANLAKANEGKYDPNILFQITHTDLETLDPIDAIAYQELMNDPKREIYDSYQEALEDVRAKYAKEGYDPDKPLSEQLPEVKRMITKDAKLAKKGFNDLVSSVKLEGFEELSAKKTLIEKQNIDRYNLVKSQSEPDIMKIRDNLETIDFPVTEKDDKGKEVETNLYDFNLGDFKKSKRVADKLAEVQNTLSEKLPAWNQDIAKEVQKAVMTDLKAGYLYANRGKIFKEMREDAVAKAKAEWQKDRDNPNPLNTTTAPAPDMTDEQKARKDAEGKFLPEVKHRIVKVH